jgi:UDP-GlcNAc:undecaprenyl-phosphate/decaprenyl-phosphate GlcNAc-1-phosphate transferase
MTQYALVLITAAVVSFVLSMVLWLVGRRFRVHREIRDRDVHTLPTPRLGGVAIFAALLVATAVATQISWFDAVFVEPEAVWALLGAAAIVVAIGFVDDVFELDWVTKLAGQILAAGLVAWQGVQIVSLPVAGLTLFSPTLSLGLTVLAIVLVMNAVNFIDGLDGLVAGVTLIASGVFFVYAFLLATGETDAPYFNYASLFTAILLGAILGFLPANWHPAKLFLGDSGSMLVGLIMATTAISVTGQIDPAQVSPSQLLPAFIPVLLPLVVLVVPLLDFTLAVLRRLRAGMSPFEADRKHLHHRLLDMGHTHMQAVLILYAWTAVMAIGTLMFLFVQWYVALAIIMLGLIGSTVVTLSPDNRVANDPLAIPPKTPEEVS